MYCPILGPTAPDRTRTYNRQLRRLEALRTSDESGDTCGDAPDTLNQYANNSDPQLLAIIDAWPGLPEQIKAEIAAKVKEASK